MARCPRVAGIRQDVTRHKRAERTLHNEERRKDEFLAMLAHELRNPLAPMRSARWTCSSSFPRAAKTCSAHAISLAGSCTI